jgi:S-adenosyl-L-methionine hydrolase (adenosine-forming)
LVTLSSDVGSAYAAQMKAVLLRGLPPERIVDLAHDLPAHGIREAAFVVRVMAAGFPAGTVHLVVVDPGVGGHRAPIVVACRDGSRLVGPDNGVLMPLATALGLASAYRIDPDRIASTPRRVGTTFDGRDLFAPVAARLAKGASPASVGPPIRPTPLALPSPRRRADGAAGEVVHVDHFGNLITNVPSAWVPRGTARLRLRLRSGTPRSLPWVNSYAAMGKGRTGVLGSSFGTIELAVGEGRAVDRFRSRIGDAVGLAWIARPASGANG